MATIGTFTRQADGSFTGSIKTLTLNVKAAQLRANDKTDGRKVNNESVKLNFWLPHGRPKGAGVH